MLGDDERCLLFLPLAHSLAKTIMLVCMEHGVTCALLKRIAKLVEEMGMTKPTFVVAVPRVFEKVFNSAHSTRRTR